MQNVSQGTSSDIKEEIKHSGVSETGLNNAKTLADTVFKGYRDDLDFNDENDVGKRLNLQSNCNRNIQFVYNYSRFNSIFKKD